MTDEEINNILPPLEGYEIMKPPENYKPAVNPAAQIMQA